MIKKGGKCVLKKKELCQKKGIILLEKTGEMCQNKREGCKKGNLCTEKKGEVCERKWCERKRSLGKKAVRHVKIVRYASV